MFDDLNQELEKFYKLFLFSFALVIMTYGFAFTNYTVTIDNELPVLQDFGMDYGRWAQNFIRYHVFRGHLQYFTLLLSLFIFTIAAVRLSKLFKFDGIAAYIFCALFLTFPQLSYQLVFSIMADVAAIGILLSVICVELFIKGSLAINVIRKVLYFLSAAFIMMFTFAIYQAFIIVPPLIYVIVFFQRTYLADFNLKAELLNILQFAAVTIAGILLYLLSVKIICPPIQNSEYLAGFLAGESGNFLLNFLSVWYNNLLGNAYYGEKMFLVSTILSIILLVKLVIERKLIIIRVVTLFAILLLPFAISAIITSGYHPPRIYVTSNLVFAFIVVFTLKDFKVIMPKLVQIGILLMLFFNIYVVTNLYYTVNKIYKHDRRIAQKIDDIIQIKYPNFNAGEKTVYFYGYFPYEYHQNMRLNNSEVFGGSFYNWDNGNNYRINNFFKKADVADYKMLGLKSQLESIKDSIKDMPKWPNYESIKMVNDIVIVKLGSREGMTLNLE